MIRPVIFLAILIFLSSSVQPQIKTDREAALQSLIAAEKEFSRTSAERGTRDAFVTFLADDGVIFNPLPANGKQVWTPREKSTGVLTWIPVFADVSASADLGFTTGPYEFRTAAGEKVIGNGYYVSVWRRNSGGGWKVALDIGTRNPPPDILPALEFPKISKGLRVKNSEAEQTALLSVDDTLSRLLAADEDSSSELGKLIGQYFRLHKTNNVPFTEKNSAVTALKTYQGKITLQTVKTEIAQSGDFGFSFGTYQTKANAERGSFVRIWRRADDGQWKLMLAVMHDAPPPSIRNGQ